MVQWRNYELVQPIKFEKFGVARDKSSWHFCQHFKTDKRDVTYWTQHSVCQGVNIYRNYRRGGIFKGSQYFIEKRVTFSIEL